MPNQIKHGLIGMVAGLIVSLAGVGIATGTYKQKVDTNCVAINKQALVLNSQGMEINGLNHDIENNKEILLELKTGQKEMLKKMDW